MVTAMAVVAMVTILLVLLRLLLLLLLPLLLLFSAAVATTGATFSFAAATATTTAAAVVAPSTATTFATSITATTAYCFFLLLLDTENVTLNRPLHSNGNKRFSGHIFSARPCGTESVKYRDSNLGGCGIWKPAYLFAPSLSQSAWWHFSSHLI